MSGAAGLNIVARAEATTIDTRGGRADEGEVKATEGHAGEDVEANV